MSYWIYPKDQWWGALLADETDHIWITPCRIIPGEWDKKASKENGKSMRRYIFHCVDGEYEDWVTRAEGYYDKCGSEVIVIAYHRTSEKRNILLKTTTNYETWYVAVIGVHSGELITMPGYPFWERCKKNVLEEKKKLLTKLVVRMIEIRAEFVPFFMPGGGVSSQVDGPM